MKKYDELENEEIKWLEMERGLGYSSTPKVPVQSITAPNRGRCTTTVKNQETLERVELQELSNMSK